MLIPEMQFPKIDLGLRKPLMNAAGILGFAPVADPRVDYSCLGAFVTHPLSFSPRMPAQATRYISFPGGFMLHTGLPNPGLKAVVRRYRDAWQRSAIPIWVHLLADEPEHVERMVLSLEDLPGVAGIELGLSVRQVAREIAPLIGAAQGELPLIVRIPLDRVYDLAEAVVKQCPQVVLSLGPGRGKLPVIGSGMLTGRLYGPSIFPQALMALEQALAYDVPVIAAGGVYSVEQARVMLEAGAEAVQLDAVIWRNGLQDWRFE